MNSETKLTSPDVTGSPFLACLSTCPSSSSDCEHGPLNEKMKKVKNNSLKLTLELMNGPGKEAEI